MKTILKVIGWTLLAIVLLVFGTLVVTIRMLPPERLTPIVQSLANKHLNADVTVASASLQLRQTYPFLTIQIDSLTVRSRDILALPQAQRDTLPAWADTLAYVGKFRAGINLPRLAQGMILLSDMELAQPSVNILIVNDSLNNFNVALPSEEETDTTSTPLSMPDVRISGFHIADAGPMRFMDMPSGLDVTARITSAAIQTEKDPAAEPPRYNIDFYTDISTPMLQPLAMHSINVGMDGTIDWKAAEPMRVALSDFTVAIDQIKAKFNTQLDFTDAIIVETFDGGLAPLPFSYLLEHAPAELEIPQDISTDAAITLQAKLLQPYVVGGSQTIPYADINIRVPQSYLRWQKVDLQKILFDADVYLCGDSLDLATVSINECDFAGPATEIAITGRLANLMSDPLFDGRIEGHTALQRMPPAVSKMLFDDAKATGNIDLNTSIKARPSMLTRNQFHRLKVDGKVHISDFTYLSADSLTDVNIRNLWAQLGTNSSINRTTPTGTNFHADSLLTAKLEVDTMHAVVPGIEMAISTLTAGIGAQNRARSSDTTSIIPMGGKISAKILTVNMPEDSLRMRLRQVDGMLTIRRFEGENHLPQVSLNASIGRIMAGTPMLRFSAKDNRLVAQIHKLADSPSSRERKRVKALADSLALVHPGLPADSIVNLAVEERTRQRAQRRGRRSAADTLSIDNETIDWGFGQDARRIFLDWDFSGKLTSASARFTSPAFPLRNRIEHLGLRFNNDSIILDEVAYQAGRSDFTMKGTVANMKRALAGRRRQPLEISFSTQSDTIDVNQLANAFFAGAAARESMFDDDLDKDIVEEAEMPDSVGPLLIPVNIDATFRMRAKNVIYSDFLLHDLRGSALISDGALNLRRLKAGSEVGSINLSALYSAPNVDNMRFAFGMELEKFRIGDFLQLLPAVDSIMPMISDFDGVLNASIAATSDVDREMNLVLPTLEAAMNLQGDSLVLLDPETFKTVAKWLLFKDKKHNVIDHMSVDLTVQDGMMTLYPFMFDFDRYKLGVQGSNDLAMNFNYHVSVLKSPIPFKFGINIKGNTDKYKIRLGRARFNEKKAAQQTSIADTTRINLINEVENIFRRGARKSQKAKLQLGERPDALLQMDVEADTISAADSLILRQEGLLTE